MKNHYFPRWPLFYYYFPATTKFFFKVVKHIQTIYHWKSERMGNIIVIFGLVIFHFANYYYHQLIRWRRWTFSSPCKGPLSLVWEQFCDNFLNQHTWMLNPSSLILIISEVLYEIWANNWNIAGLMQWLDVSLISYINWTLVTWLIIPVL